MIYAVRSSSHVPFVSTANLRQLVQEVRQHGPGPVFDNRASRADLLHKAGHEESAQEAEREAGFILDVYA